VYILFVNGKSVEETTILDKVISAAKMVSPVPALRKFSANRALSTWTVRKDVPTFPLRYPFKVSEKQKFRQRRYAH